MIKIESPEMYKEFIDFRNDPQINILEEKDHEIGKVYKFNTGEEILVPNSYLKEDNRDDLIFGKDKTTNIVSIDVEDNIVYLYKEINSKIETEIRDNVFWLLAPKPYDGFKRLKGNGYYKYIYEVPTRYEFEKARQKNYMKKLNMYSVTSSEEATLIQQGITYFKGMKVEDVSVLSFDIEATTLKHNEDSRVLIISNSFRKNGKIINKMFSIDDYDNNDAMMIDEWTKWVRKIDPSVITGHNIFSYDIPYLNFCYSRTYGQDLQLGRNKEAVVFNTYTSQFRKDGSQSYEYTNFKIRGREVVDTFFLSMKYDTSRQFPSYGLKPIIKHLGLEKEGRQHYDASQIGKNWNRLKEREKIKQYAEEDAGDALALYNLMIPSFFYLTQSVPKTLQQIINTATGSQLNSFMVRAYLQHDMSIPQASEPVPFEGAISMGIPGIYKNVRKVDVASLYPSIMRQYKVYDKFKDPKGYLLQAMEYFTEQRLFNKKLANETGDKYYKDLDQSQKTFINSAYGFLGAPGLLFNSPRNAAFVTKKGREILLKAVEWATGHTLAHVPKKEDNEDSALHWVIGDKIGKGKGYQLINTDTDSLSYTNGIKPTKEEFDKEIEELNSLFPEKINFADDGILDKFIVVKAKNYITEKDGKVKIKGSSLIDQKKEKSLKEMLDTMIKYILNDKSQDLVPIYDEYIKEAMQIKDINRWTMKKTVTKALFTSERKNETKVLEALDQDAIQEGDKVWLYSALDGMIQDEKKGEKIFLKNGNPKMIENRILKTPEKWTQDEDKMHYISRVWNTVKILENILDLDKFPKYHLAKSKQLLDNLLKT